MVRLMRLLRWVAISAAAVVPGVAALECVPPSIASPCGFEKKTPVPRLANGTVAYYALYEVKDGVRVGNDTSVDDSGFECTKVRGPEDDEVGGAEFRAQLCGSVACSNYCQCDEACYSRKDLAEYWGAGYSAFFYFLVVSWMVIFPLSVYQVRIVLATYYSKPKASRIMGPYGRVALIISVGAGARFIWVISPKENAYLIEDLWPTPFRALLLKITQIAVLAQVMQMAQSWREIVNNARSMSRRSAGKNSASRGLNIGCYVLVALAVPLETLKLFGFTRVHACADCSSLRALQSGLTRRRTNTCFVWCVLVLGREFGVVMDGIFTLYVMVLGTLGCVYGIQISSLLSGLVTNTNNLGKSQDGGKQQKKVLDELRKVRNLVLINDFTGIVVFGALVGFFIDMPNPSAHLGVFVCVHFCEVLILAISLSVVWKPYAALVQTRPSQVAATVAGSTAGSVANSNAASTVVHSDDGRGSSTVRTGSTSTGRNSSTRRNSSDMQSGSSAFNSATTSGADSSRNSKSTRRSSGSNTRMDSSVNSTAAGSTAAGSNL